MLIIVLGWIGFMVGGLRGRDTVVLILVSVFGVFIVAMYGWFVCCYAWVRVWLSNCSLYSLLFWLWFFRCDILCCVCWV